MLTDVQSDNGPAGELHADGDCVHVPQAAHVWGQNRPGSPQERQTSMFYSYRLLIFLQEVTLVSCHLPTGHTGDSTPAASPAFLMEQAVLQEHSPRPNTTFPACSSLTRAPTPASRIRQLPACCWSEAEGTEPSWRALVCYPAMLCHGGDCCILPLLTPASQAWKLLQLP